MWATMQQIVSILVSCDFMIRMNSFLIREVFDVKSTSESLRYLLSSVSRIF